MAGGIGRAGTATRRTVVGAFPRTFRGGLLHRIAELAIAAPTWTVAIAALVMVVAGIFGIPVAKSLSAGGLQDPTSESARATKLLIDKFGQGDLQLLFIVSDRGGVPSTAARAVGTDIADQLSRSSHVTSVTSAWTAPPAAASSLVSQDGRSGLIVADISGGESNAQRYADALSERFARDRHQGTARAGGGAVANTQTHHA